MIAKSPWLRLEDTWLGRKDIRSSNRPGRVGKLLNSSANTSDTVKTMDGFNVDAAPPAYQQVKWLADAFVALMGIGWSINYVGMVRQSFRDQTYGMAIIPLCNNIGWEMVYAFVYPSKSAVERTVFVTGLSLNVGVMYAAVKFSPEEWKHAPIIQKNLTWIFGFGVTACFTGHLALAMEIGPSLAYSWGAVICQIILSIGGLEQLLARNSTRGASWMLW